jgi:two-component system sensor histidine kinase TctE
MINGYSLRQQLIVQTAVIMAIVFLMLSAGIWSYAKRAADISFNRLLNSASISILERVTVREGQIDLDLPYAALSMLELAPDDKIFYEVLDHNGQHLTGYTGLPEPKNYVPSSQPQFYTEGYKGEALSMVVQSKRIISPVASGWVTILLGQTRQARNELADEIFYNALFGLIGILLLTLLLVGFGIRQTLLPLNQISDLLKRRPILDRSPIPETPIQEAAPLVNAINDYQSQLLQNLDTMQMFIADASHQIRSSLGGLQGQLDIALQTDNPKDLQLRLSKIRHQYEQLTRLTNQLLAHALVTHRSDTQYPEVLHLNKWVTDILTEVVRDYAHTPIEFSYHADDDQMKIQGDRISLKEALRNVLDNAVKYGPPDNHIDVRLSVELVQQKMMTLIQIDDRGPGIPPHLRRQATRRFSRLLNNTHNGSGLGLAIVDTVVTAHEGVLKLSDSPSGGLRVKIYLPILPPNLPKEDTDEPVV